MGKIYSKALGIIIWLGRESSDTEGIVWLHNYFIPPLRDKLAIQPEQFQGSDATRDLDPKRCQDLGLDSPTLYAQSYAEFCRRSWFTRTWIVQEVAVASRVRAVIGNVILEWWDMINLAHLFQANRGGIGFHFKTKLRMSNPGVEPRLDVTRLLQTQRLCHESARGFIRGALQGLARSDANATFRSVFLLQRVNENRICKCSDERDKIYAVLGMVDHIFPPETDDETLFPRYDNLVEDVFSDMTCWSMRHNPLLLVLSLVEEPSRRRLKNLPSWVPDFSSDPCTSMFGFRDFYNTPGDHLPATIITTVNIPTLTTPGALLDTIVTSIRLDPQVAGGVERVLSLCAHINQPYQKEQTRLEALWRTMIANCWVLNGSRTYPAPSSMAHSFQAWILSRVILCKARPLYQDAQDLFLALHGQFDKSGPIEVALKQACGTLEALVATNGVSPTGCSLEDIQKLVHFGDGYKVVDAMGPTYPSPVLDNLLQRFAEYDEAFYSATHERCLYMTRKGFIGLGPLSTKPSDQVFTFKAARVPFVLRPVDPLGSFNLIGEAYVHGFINGGFAAAGEFPGWTDVDLV
jgi:Heterokaryon incompatibility protein (HET)